MNTKHTPGPWRLAEHPMEIIQNGSAIFTMCDAISGLPLPTADMRLIAAAPELAEALDRVYQFLYENYKDSDMPDILPMVRAALAKAGL